MIITEPTKIEIFKFAEDMLPPDSPGSVNTPDEVEAGTVIDIQWDTVNGATEYELVRYAAPKSDTIQFVAAAANERDNVAYGLRAVNFIGDKSQEAMSSTIIKDPSR